jgi:hypothetical protein
VPSILGAAVGILGAIAVTAFAVSGSRPRAAVAGMTLTVVANVLLTASFGSAAFIQPGIGRAYLAGVEGMEALNADTAYGTPLITTMVVLARRLSDLVDPDQRRRPGPVPGQSTVDPRHGGPTDG